MSGEFLKKGGHPRWVSVLLFSLVIFLLLVSMLFLLTGAETLRSEIVLSDYVCRYQGDGVDSYVGAAYTVVENGLVYVGCVSEDGDVVEFVFV